MASTFRKSCHFPDTHPQGPYTLCSLVLERGFWYYSSQFSIKLCDRKRLLEEDLVIFCYQHVYRDRLCAGAGCL
jgi:hypothetical protein